MRVLNRTILVGRLASEPELRYSVNGTAVTNFLLAVDRPFQNAKGGRETDVFPIGRWPRRAAGGARSPSKGRRVAAAGRLQTRSYQGQGGGTRWVTEVVADNVRFLDWPKEQQQADAADEGGEFGDEWEDDEVPF